MLTNTIAYYCGGTLTFLFFISVLIIQLIKLCVAEFKISQDDVESYLAKLRFPLNIARIIPVEDYFEIKWAESLQIVIFAGGCSTFLTYVFTTDLLTTSHGWELLYQVLVVLLTLYTNVSIISGLYDLIKDKRRRKRR